MHDIAITGTYFFLIALLYSTVGHAGASGYLATMALLSFPAGVMKPTALMLNIIVALITTVRFSLAGYFSWRLFWPFALASAPLAYLGGGFAVHAAIYKILVGTALIFSAAYLILRNRIASDEKLSPSPGLPVSLAAGGVIGFISGLTGVGGGIFLSPVLIMFRWAGLRKTAAVSAAFILINSITGLMGFIQKGGAVPENIGWFSMAVVGGGIVGSSLGATSLNNKALRVLLSMILALAGLKLAIV